MGQTPRWYRKQLYEHKLRDVLNSPYADVSQVQSARKAVEEKLDQDDRKYNQSLRKVINKYKGSL